MRWGECVGLRRDAVHLDSAEVQVVRVAVEINGHMSIRPSPKSKRSRRTVPVPPFAVELLKAHRKKYPANHAGGVFSNAAGGPLRRSLFRQRIGRPALVQAGLLRKVIEKGEHRFIAVYTDDDGLEVRSEFMTERDAVQYVARHASPGLRFHDLRHSYATWLVSNRVPINDAQRAMGHEKSTTLLDLYTHGSKDGGKAIRDAMSGTPMLPLCFRPSCTRTPRRRETNRRATPDQRVLSVGGTGFEPATPTVSR